MCKRTKLVLRAPMSFYRGSSNENVQTTHSSLYCRGQFTVPTGQFTVSVAQFCTHLQRTKMVKLDENDTGGAMAAQAHSTNSARKTDFTMTRH